MSTGTGRGLAPPEVGTTSTADKGLAVPSREFRQTTDPPVAFDWARSRDIVVTIVGGAAILYGLSWLLDRIITIVLVFLLSGVAAFMLEPLVGRLQRSGFKRGGATAVVYVSILLALGGALFGIGGGLVDQFSQLNQQLPVYSRELQEQVIPSFQSSLASRNIPIDLSQLQSQAGSALQSIGSGVVQESLTILTGVTGVLVNFVLVVVISLYLVLDATKVRDGLDRIVPAKFHRELVFVETSLVRVLGGYIRGQLIMAAIIAFSSGVGCWLLGVKYALVIGVLAFFFELIPMLGPVLAAIPAIVVSLFQPFPLVLWVIVFFIVMQLVESNVLGPRITGHAVGLHPVAAILALVGGAEVAGVWGALFAVPVVGLAVVLVMAGVNELRGGSPDELIRPRKAWRVSLPRRP